MASNKYKQVAPIIPSAWRRALLVLSIPGRHPLNTARRWASIAVQNVDTMDRGI